jgi:putative FmdB family regulatory protein
MPTYQYACTECDHAFEQFQSFSEDSLTECPQCSGRLRKLFNAVGVVFKGSGFYRTDSRSTTSAAEPAGSSSTETKTEKKSETKTESKAPAASAS